MNEFKPSLRAEKVIPPSSKGESHGKAEAEKHYTEFSFYDVGPFTKCFCRGVRVPLATPPKEEIRKAIAPT